MTAVPDSRRQRHADEHEERVQRRLRGSARPRREIGPADRSRPLLLSTGQEQMWVLHRLDPASPAYLVSWVLQLTGALDVEGVRHAFEQVVHRHEVLRTRYRQDGAEPVQIVDPPSRFTLTFVDLADRPEAEAEGLRIVDQQRSTPFDLVNEAPLRVTVVRTGPQRHLFTMVTHHIACDGYAYHRIAAEVSAYYAGHLRGEPVDLPAVPVQYADYAAWERAGRTRGALDRHLAYWRNRLDGLDTLPLPVDGAHPDRPGWQGAIVRVDIPAQTSNLVRELATARRTSPTTVMLAAYQAMLSQVSGSPDVAVGMPVTLRTRPELDRLVGYAINTVVVRAQCPIQLSFASLLAEVRSHLLDALDHREVPFSWLVNELRPTRVAAGNPLFRVAFDMNPTERGAFDLPGLDIVHIRQQAVQHAKFDLTLHVEEAPNGRFYAALEYATALFPADTARELAGLFGRLLEQATADPYTSLAELQVLARAARGPVNSGRPARPVPPSAAGLSEPVGDIDPDLLARLEPVWQQVLGLAQVDPAANFFDLGGDSLQAVALAARLSAAGFEVAAVDIFAYQSIQELAPILAGRSRAADLPAGIPPFAMVTEADRGLLPQDVVDAYPVGAAQLGMIVEMRTRPELSRYQDTTSFLVRDDDGLDLAALRGAAQAAVDRHDVLRTTFDLNSYSAPLQLVHGRATITVDRTRHGRLDQAGWQSRLLQYAETQRQRRFDLTQAPLVRLHAHTGDGTTDWWLSLTECHPILEGWSCHSLIMEIVSRYHELRAGRTPAAAEPVPFRFADHIAAEQAALRSESDRAFWRGVVDGRTSARPPLAWRGDPAAPPQRYLHRIPFLDLADDLREVAARTRTSLKAVLLAAHLKVLSVVAETDRFYTGLVCDARPEIVGADRVPGMYLNTLPFPMPHGSHTWGGFVTAVYRDLTDVWAHRRYPMQAIQREVGRRPPLLDVMFNYLDFHQVDKRLIEWGATVDQTENEFALHVSTISGVVQLNTTTHFLSRENTARLGAIYRTVLESIAADPDASANAACLPEAEIEAVAVAGTGAALVTTGRSPAETYAGWVRDRPDALAVRCGGDSLTYGQLDAFAGRLACRLRDAGVGRGDIVGVAPVRDVWVPAQLFAVWQVGAAWLPLDPETPVARLRELADTVGLAAFVKSSTATTSTTRIDGVPVVAAGAELLGLQDGTVGRISDWLDRVRPHPGETACLYPDPTSGAAPFTTITHDALAHALSGLASALASAGTPTTDSSGWLFSSALTSLAALSELLLPLTTGGQVVVSRPAVPDQAVELTELIASGAVTHAQATPLVAERMVPEGSCPAGLTMIVGGDPHTSLPESWYAAGPGRPTPVAGGAGIPGWVTVDGRPLPGLTVRIVDTQLRPVPVGVRGELAVSGPAVPNGYFDDPARTAEDFVPDPFHSGTRLFRTGLLARVRADGRIEQLGPIHRQAGPDGHPLELSHARQVLGTLPAVRDGYLLRHVDGTAGLTGFLRPVTGGSPDPAQIRRALADRLPRRLVPDRVLLLDDWPLTGHGALDVDALLRRSAPVEPTAGGGKPWDERFEELLRAALPLLPDDEELAPDLELAAFGLDSLTIVELLVTVEQTYDILLSEERLVFDVFATPVALWAEIDAVRAEEPPTGAAR
ncbi:condensation domain-containing protein [Plantactinospora sp. WMMC1484]|uniref:condensation domain-containing protein n=1 Tax=Plantactinospora sp. WMMC1484 TaxID=3404122 RepID=UPI003BF5AF08